MRYRRSKLSPGIAAFLALAMLPLGLAGQQTGQITGRTIDSEGNPLSDVQISLENTTLGTLSNADGRFLLLNVPVGIYQVNAQRIGFGTRSHTDVNVEAGGQAVVDFTMTTQVLALQELVVTGTVDPTEGVKLPFTVGRISTENMSIPTTGSALKSLTGKVAGVSVVQGSGQPGQGVSILLRTPTSATRSNSPMYVVDGVILGSGTTDLESMDIESVEVVKGAAAASLYGSRASAGVIQITTKRGSSLAIDQTQLKVRTEYGVSQLPRVFPTSSHHHYLQNADGTWVDKDSGLPTTGRDNRALDPDGFMDNEYQNPVYNNIDGIINDGSFLLSTVSVAKNSLTTNFLGSFSNYDEAGILKEHDGYTRRSFRLNVDHRIGDAFSVSMSAFHSRSEQDDLQGNPWYDTVQEFERDIELGQKDCVADYGPNEGKPWYCQVPDESVDLYDPVWRQAATQNLDKRARTLISGDMRWRPYTGLSFNGNLSYDRADIFNDNYSSKEVPPAPWSDSPTLGSVYHAHTLRNTLNGFMSGTYTRPFGRLTTRTTARALFERESEDYTSASGSDLAVIDVPDLDVAINQSIGGSYEEIRANAYLAQIGLDWEGKYILDVLGRRDESSLFGADARTNDYYRVAGSWRMAQESWWPFQSINEFKLRAAQGTAGNRPDFEDQYETWSVSVSGDGTTSVGKGSLGNNNLKPEFSTERDFGIDMIFNDKYSLQLSYIQATTEDLILDVPLPAVTGYSTQVVNTGTMEGNTYEATFEAQLINESDFSWNISLVADRSRSEIIDWNRSCYSGTLRYYCDNAGLGDMWAFQHVENMADLPASLQGRESEFAVNDDGYLVWVGTGNSWKDGVSKGLWGTQMIDDATGRAYDWGIPFLKVDSLDIVTYEQVGKSEPDLGWGWLNNIRYKGFNIHTHLQGQIGGNVYNQGRQRTYFELKGHDQDQFGKSDETKKPFNYYTRLYNGYDNSKEFVEPGWYVKLRTVSVTYALGPSVLEPLRLAGLSQVDLGLIVRNALTWTDYQGWDPEAGQVLNRIEGSSVFPKMRQITGYVEITF